MKKIKIVIGLAMLPFISVSQSTTAANLQNGGQTRFLGFNNNFPLYTKTAGLTRTRLNGTLTNNYFGFNHDVSGFFGIGLNQYFQTNSPLAMMHLEGENNTAFGGGQWRPWMKTGKSIS